MEEIKQGILDCIESSLALSGYEIMQGNADILIIRSADSDLDFQISVKYIPA